MSAKPFHCGVCPNKSFKSKAALKAHAASKHPSNAHRCSHCHAGFQSQFNLDNHIFSKHPYKCLFCKDRLDDASQWTLHMDTTHKKQCSSCPIFYWNSAELTAHVKAMHAETCPICFMEFSTVIQRRDHTLLQHTGYCAYCTEHCETPASLDFHYRLGHPQLVCTDCGLIFCDESYLLSHRERVHLLKCIECDKYFQSTEGLKQHSESKHFKKCGTCGALFSSSKKLEDHRKSKHYTHACTSCNARFPSTKSRDEHMKNVHGLKCPFCAEKLLTKEKKLSHIREVHRSHCEICFEVFPTRRKFFSHKEEVHNEIMCWVCPPPSKSLKKFSTTIGRDAHIAAKHKLAFFCDTCGNKFQTRLELQKHEDTHQITYACADCGFEFESEKEWLEHLDRHKLPELPTIDEKTCPKCYKTFKSKSACQNHLNSAYHNPPAPGIKCLGSGCDREFGSPSAMLMHLESSACASGMSKAEIDRLVHEKDKKKIICNDTGGLNKRALITFGRDCSEMSTSTSSSYIINEVLDSEGESCVGGMMTPFSIITAASGYNSPVYDLVAPINYNAISARLETLTELPYRCPDLTQLGLVSTQASHRDRLFKTLSGLTQHIEATECTGGRKTLPVAMKFLETVLTGGILKGRIVKFLKDH